MFDPPEGQPYLAINVSVVNSPAHQALALQAALEGVCTLISALVDLALTCVQTVLLKNQNNALPLSTSTIKTVAVIGPNGNATTTMQGACYTNSLISLTPITANYYGIACNIVSPLEGIASFANVVSAPGCDISDPSVAGFGQACTVRASAPVYLGTICSCVSPRHSLDAPAGGSASGRSGAGYGPRSDPRARGHGPHHHLLPRRTGSAHRKGCHVRWRTYHIDRRTHGIRLTLHS